MPDIERKVKTIVTDNPDREDLNSPVDYDRYVHTPEETAGFIPDTEKGTPGGVATLGEDGKVPEEQLPPITTEETDPTVPAWAKEDSKPTYTAAEIGLGNVENVTNAERIAGLLYNPTYNSDTHTLTIQVKGGNAFVVDLPLEALITNISLNEDNELVITFEDGSTAEVPLSALLVGVAKSVNGKSADSNGAVSVAIADIPGLEAALAEKAPSEHTHTVNQITDFPAIPGEQVNADWNASSGKAQILNKPTIPAAYTLPTASESVLGGVKVGAGLSITDGVLSADGGGGGIISSVEVLGDWS